MNALSYDLYGALKLVLDSLGALSAPHELLGYGISEDEAHKIFDAYNRAVEKYPLTGHKVFLVASRPLNCKRF